MKTNELIAYLPFLIPVVLLEFALAITALVHILRHDRFKFGNKVLWAVVSLCIGIIGPILYFTIGRSDD